MKGNTYECIFCKHFMALCSHYKTKLRVVMFSCLFAKVWSLEGCLETGDGSKGPSMYSKTHLDCSYQVRMFLFGWLPQAPTLRKTTRQVQTDTTFACVARQPSMNQLHEGYSTRNLTQHICSSTAPLFLLQSPWNTGKANLSLYPCRHRIIFSP